MKSLSVVESPKARKGSDSSADEVLAKEPHESSSSPTLDFIGSSVAVKDLFALPYAVDQPISVAVHNLGGTLLIDRDPEGEPTLPHPVVRPKAPFLDEKENEGKDDERENVQDAENENNNSSRSLVAVSSLEETSEALTIVHSVIQQTSQKSNQGLPSVNSNKNESDALIGMPNPDAYAHHYIPPAPEPREYLSWKFHDMNLLVGSDALIYRAPSDPQSTALTVRVEDTNTMKAMLEIHQNMVKSGSFIADHQIPKHRQEGKPSYAEATRKTVGQLADRKHSDDEQKENQTDHGSDSTHFRDFRNFAAPDLDRVQLQTCIVPAPTVSVGSLLNSPPKDSVVPSSDSSTTPVKCVLDTYLDNIMANVPQLALCLREKGFVQSIKLLNTDAIPSRLMHASTLDITTPYEIINDSSAADEMFSPQIMEMNASALLRFLKTNCTKDNATYLLRREAGQTNIQLYDISSISAQRQQKWIWWLAMISYRFANRLRHISSNTSDNALRRTFRDRQRSLLQNTLDLLEALADMNGNAHESLVAAVKENLADTFLNTEDHDNSLFEEPPTKEVETNPNSPPPITSVSPQQPYSKSTLDALNKAQDHLTRGSKILWSVLDESVQQSKHKNEKKSRHSRSKVNVRSVHVNSQSSDSASSSDSDDDAEIAIPASEQIDPVATQLFGLHHKLINVSLRLAEIHLKNYYSSSAMQALRSAARRIADSLYLAQLRNHGNSKDAEEWINKLQLQFTWLWEHCGHFARSFAADELWRDRGHASGDDVVSLLQDVEAAFTEHKSLVSNGPLRLERFTQHSTRLTENASGKLSLHSLSGVVCQHNIKNQVDHGVDDSGVTESDEALVAAIAIVEKQKLLQRDQRKVLVAACISYDRAIKAFDSFAALKSFKEEDNQILDKSLVQLLHQRLGDACNEVGKIMLNELRNLLSSDSGNVDNDKKSTLIADALLSSAEFWFLQGLHAFEESQDLRNIALLRCNLCQCYKLRANNIFAKSKQTTASLKGNEASSHAEVCLQEGAHQLQAAHETLGERDADPRTWDMVSSELAATFLVLGVRRRQSLIGSGNIPLIAHALRLAPGKERSIVEPMERALQIYDQMNNSHQAAAAHYQLALFYSKIWTCQRDEAKTREKLGAAFNHYSSAFSYFSQAIRGNEVTFCLLCMDLASLYAAVSGEECLNKALACCLDTEGAFSQESIEMATSNLQARDEWIEKMCTLATSVEERVFKLLRCLIKLEEEGKPVAKYKELYRVGLQAKMTASGITRDIMIGDEERSKKAGQLLALRDVLKAISLQNTSA